MVLFREKTRPARPLVSVLHNKIRPTNPYSGTHREKTRPTHQPIVTPRDKIRPAQQKPSVLARFRPAGRKISRFLRRHSTQGDLCRATSGRFLLGSTSSSLRLLARATESSRWHSHGVHFHHVAWRLGCFERNIAPAWDCACRHEILIAPARLKPLILPLFQRAGVVFLSRRPSNTQHSGAQGRYFFHGGYEHAAQWRAGAMFLSLSGRAPTYIGHSTNAGDNRKTACKASTRSGAGDHSPAPLRLCQCGCNLRSARNACASAKHSRISPSGRLHQHRTLKRRPSAREQANTRLADS